MLALLYPFFFVKLNKRKSDFEPAKPSLSIQVQPCGNSLYQPRVKQLRTWGTSIAVLRLVSAREFVAKVGSRLYYFPS